MLSAGMAKKAKKNTFLIISIPGVMVKAMDSRILVSEFEIQLRYYVHFRTNNLGKGMNLLAMG